MRGNIPSNSGHCDHYINALLGGYYAADSKDDALLISEIKKHPIVTYTQFCKNLDVSFDIPDNLKLEALTLDSYANEINEKANHDKLTCSNFLDDYKKMHEILRGESLEECVRSQTEAKVNLRPQSNYFFI